MAAFEASTLFRASSLLVCWSLLFAYVNSGHGQTPSGPTTPWPEESILLPSQPPSNVSPAPASAVPMLTEPTIEGDVDLECHDSCCYCCNVRPYGYWVSAELLVWWRKGMDLPQLVTNNDMPVPRVLFGEDQVGSGARPGGRLHLGCWLEACQTSGIGGSLFALGEQSINFDSRATGEPVVVRPFFEIGVPMILPVNNPDPDNPVVGGVTAQTTSDVHGADVHYRSLLWCDDATRLDYLIGYQTTWIDTSLTIRHRFTSGGVDFDGTDRFATKNAFHGAEFGLLAQHHSACFSFELLAKLGLGNMRGTVAVDGSDVSTDGPNASLLVRESNAGVRVRNEFAAVRELGIHAVYHWNGCVDFFAGYSLIYWKHVLQAGDQVDLNRPNPQPLMNESSYFVQGINFGVLCRF